ncbi:MAG: CDP-alcohol phosphatidyltransferase family protein [Kiritimatiellia bacterium]|nr:CDP-alcohol phosphatidyltransferase family protein [Kiritimatiellia bacterium]
MKWRQAVPTSVTIVAMLSGFLSILVTMEGIRTGEPYPYYRWAAQLIMLAMILDGIDGNVARALRGQSEFGGELDTYVDMTAFGIAPAILIFAVTLHGSSLWRIVLPSAVALSGVVRLARFKVKDPLRGQGGYAGLPITGNAGWVALFVFISQTPPLERFSLNEGSVAVLFLLGIVIFIALQVSNVRYPKPTKKTILFIPCVILVGLLFVPLQKFSVRVAVVILVLGLGYGVFGPLFVKGVAVHKARREAARYGRGA